MVIKHTTCCRFPLFLRDPLQILTKLALHIIKFVRLDPLQKISDLSGLQLACFTTPYELLLKIEALLFALVCLNLPICPALKALKFDLVLMCLVLKVSMLRLKLLVLTLVEPEVGEESIPLGLT